MVSINFGQTTVINDPLSGGSSSGVQYGGSFTTEGFIPGVGTNHILYTVPSTATNGYVEFEVKGVNSSIFPTDAEHGFIIMYDGRGINEPVNYLPEFRENFFRWNLHWRESRSAFKAVISCAAPTPERLNATYAVFPGNWTLEDRDFTEEPTGSGISWNPSTWYTIKVEWKDKHFKVFVDGIEKWSAHGPYDYDPIDHKIWLGSGTGKYGADISNIVYRNFKVVDYGGGTVVNSLVVSPSSRTVSNLGGTVEFDVASNVSWSVSDDADWISVTPESSSNNGTINAIYDENTTTSSRTGIITVSGGGITRTVSVVQNGVSNNTLTVTPSAVSVSASSGAASLTVLSDTDWTVSESESWFSTSPTSGTNNGTITINYDQNSVPTSRSGNITVSAGGITTVVTVTQSGVSGLNYLNLSPSTISVSELSGTGSFSISSNVDWTVSDDASWLNKSPSSGSGDGTLAVAFTENLESQSRTATITVSGGGLSKNVTVVQLGGNPYQIMLSTNPLEGGTVEGEGFFGEGTEITVNAIPDSMWKFKNWTENDSVVSTDSNYTFIVNSDRNLVANFSKLYNVMLSTNPVEGGFVEGEGTYEDSSSVTVKARSDSNWKFINWTEADTIVSTDTSWTFNILSNRVLVANFSQLLRLSVVANVSQGGTVEGGGSYEMGDEVTIVAVPSSGWIFENWIENDSVVSSDSSWTFTLNTSRDFVARFSITTNINDIRIPSRFNLSQNFPNPFNPSTTISFGVPEQSKVKIILYNMLGQEIRQIVNMDYSTGYYSFQYDASDLPSGIYIYSINAIGVSGTNFVETKKMILMK